MEKSYNDIKLQYQRIITACAEHRRFCLNAKNTVDIQHIAQLKRKALCQHGFPVFGNFDRDEKRPRIYREQPKSEPVKVEVSKQTKVVQSTPTEQATERMALHDWMAADVNNRRKIHELARHQYMNRMYAELLFDMQVCKMEGWDVFEFPRMLRDAIVRLFPKPKQLSIQFA